MPARSRIRPRSRPQPQGPLDTEGLAVVRLYLAIALVIAALVFIIGRNYYSNHSDQHSAQIIKAKLDMIDKIITALKPSGLPESYEEIKNALLYNWTLEELELMYNAIILQHQAGNAADQPSWPANHFDRLGFGWLYRNRYKSQ